MVPAWHHHPRHIQGSGATWQLCRDHYGVDSRHRAELAGGVRGSFRGQAREADQQARQPLRVLSGECGIMSSGLAMWLGEGWDLVGMHEHSGGLTRHVIVVRCEDVTLSRGRSLKFGGKGLGRSFCPPL